MPADTRSPFQLRKIGHVVLNVADLDASVRFYTEVLGLEVSDRYPDSMVPGGMIPTHGVAWPLKAILTISLRSMP